MFKRYPSKFALFQLLFICYLFSGFERAQGSASCPQYLDGSPLTRTTVTGEEQVVNGNYEAVAQQYNAVSGQITSVVFWARVNPASGSASNTVKVVIYSANLGLPGVILGSQNVLVDSASLTYPVTANFSTPVSVSGSIIISIEPFSPVADNFFVRRNTHPDGQYLYLNKLKQANQWFKNLAAGGDTTLNFDFLILPVKTQTLTAAFTYGASGNTTNFINTSTNGTSYLWNFGDGDTSTAVSPSHNYAATANYTVTLIVYANGVSTCSDTVITSVPVVIAAVSPSPVKKNAGITLASGIVQDVLTLESGSSVSIRIMDVLGNQVGKYDLKQNEKQQIRIDHLKPGIYLVNADNNKSIRFVKTK
jgi:hypothetical protein